MKLFVFGLGYSAAVLASELAAEGWSLAGTSTTAAGTARLAARGWRGFVFDGQRPGDGIAAALSEASHVLQSIPPGVTGDVALAHHGHDIMAAPHVGWIGYLSTVAVYGDRAGGWVDEASEPAPLSERGRRRLEAERAWLELGAARGKPVMVFRLPGIYGPGRSAIDDLRDGTARRLVKAGQVFNRIHVADIAGALRASMARPVAGEVYNVTDDEPAPPQDVVAHAARLLDLPPPPEILFEAAELSPMARSFYSENKRVSNQKLKEGLGYALRCPTYREGLAAVLAATR